MAEKVSRRKFLMAGSSLGLISAVWPEVAPSQTRDDCVFCRFVLNREKCFKLWEDKNFLAFLDHKPVNPGHTLLIPKQHFEYIFELDKRLYAKIFQRARELAKPLRTAAESKRIGLIVEGFGVAHLHLHLVPISKSGELLKKGATDVSAEEFSRMAEKITAQIKSDRSRSKKTGGS